MIKDSDVHTSLSYIGENLYLLRKLELGLTQEEFAELVGMSKDAVSKIERGVVMPSLKSMADISAATNKPIDYFLKKRSGR